MRTLIKITAPGVPDIYQGNETWVMPIPATFVINREGVVTARFVDPDYRNRMTIEELLAALKAAISADDRS